MKMFFTRLVVGRISSMGNRKSCGVHADIMAFLSSSKRGALCYIKTLHKKYLNIG